MKIGEYMTRRRVARTLRDFRMMIKNCDRELTKYSAAIDDASSAREETEAGTTYNGWLKARKSLKVSMGEYETNHRRR